MSSDDAELARAYAELAKAEQQAALLESQLKSLEDKLDAILADHNDEDAHSLTTVQPPVETVKDSESPTSATELSVRTDKRTNP